MHAVNENHNAASVLGVNIFRTKLIAYGVGGFMVGVSGGLYGYRLGFSSPDFFSIAMTIDHYVMILFGGLGFVWGALLGSGLVVILKEGLRDIMPFLSDTIPGLELSIGPMRLILFGVIVIAVLAIEPKGLISLLGKIKEYLRKWPYAY
jgi:branched-chain amino acid transport system permease protein